jgi:hypothetical protein
VIDKLPCGCKSDSQRWLELCASHKAEVDEIHTRWNRELRDSQQPQKEAEPWE